MIYQFTQLARQDGRIVIAREHMGLDFGVMGIFRRGKWKRKVL